MIYEHLFALYALNWDVRGNKGLFSSIEKARSFYRVLLVKANQKITSHPSWPFFLPADPEQLANDIFDELEATHKKIANEAPTPSSPKSSTDAGAPPSADNV